MTGVTQRTRWAQLATTVVGTPDGADPALLPRCRQKHHARDRRFMGAGEDRWRTLGCGTLGTASARECPMLVLHMSLNPLRAPRHLVLRIVGNLIVVSGVALAFAVAGWNIEQWRAWHWVIGGVPLVIGTSFADRGERLAAEARQQSPLTPTQARAKQITNFLLLLGGALFAAYFLLRHGLNLPEWPLPSKVLAAISVVASGSLARPIQHRVEKLLASFGNP